MPDGVLIRQLPEGIDVACGEGVEGSADKVLVGVGHDSSLPSKRAGRSLRLGHPPLNDPAVPVAPYLARPGLDDAHGSSFGRAGPGALADVAADPLGVVRPAGEQFGNRALHLLPWVVIGRVGVGTARRR